MLRHTLIPLDARSEWKDALKGIPHSFGQTWENCYAVALTSRLPTYLWHLEVEGVRVACPFTERNWEGCIDIAKPYGYSGFVGTDRCPDFAKLWREFACSRGYVCGYLGIDPVFEAPGQFDPAESSQYDRVHLLDLSIPVEQMWLRLSHNRQDDFRDWNEISSRITTVRSEIVPFFVEQFLAYMERKQAAAHYRFTRATLEFLCGLDNVLLMGMRDGDVVTAVALIPYTRYVGEALFTVYAPGTPAYTSVFVWSGALGLRERGVRLMNLGGGTSGMHAFKRSFGTAEKPLRCLRQVYDENVYGRLCLAKGASATSREGYFPAYRQAE